MNQTTSVATAPQTLTPQQVDDLALRVEQTITGMIQAGQSRAARALAKSDQIYAALANTPVENISDDDDLAIATHLSKMEILCKSLEADRKPITSRFDQIRSQFTAIENQLSIAKLPPDSTTAKLVKMRNDRASWKLQKQREEEQKRMVETGKANERVSIKADIEMQLTNKALDHITSHRSRMTNAFNSCNLSNIDAIKDTLMGWSSDYTRAVASQVQTQMPYRYLMPGDVTAIVNDIVHAKFESLQKQVETELAKTVEDLIERIPSRKAELTEIENASKAEKIKLQQEADARQRAEAADLAQKALAEKEAATSAVQTDVAISQAQIQFDATSQSQMSVVDAKEDVELRVDSVAGWMEILKFYVKNVAPGLLPTDLEKKLGFMRKEAEKAFKKTGEKIMHKDVHYVPVVSAKKSK